MWTQKVKVDVTCVLCKHVLRTDENVQSIACRRELSRKMLFLRVTRDIADIDQYRYRDISSDCIYDVTHHFCDSEGKVDAETTQRWRASGIDSVSRPYATDAIINVERRCCCCWQRWWGCECVEELMCVAQFISIKRLTKGQRQWRDWTPNSRWLLSPTFNRTITAFIQHRADATVEVLLKNYTRSRNIAAII